MHFVVFAGNNLIGSFEFQYDNKGRTLLHDIVLRGDLEGLLFLLSVRVNINSRTSDTAKLTPLHLAVQTGDIEFFKNVVHL